MKRWAAATAALALAATAAHAADRDRGVVVSADCEIDSPYEFRLTDRSVVYTRATGTPRTVLIRDGKLFIDEAWVAVSEADARRLREFERGTRASMPLVQQIGRDAAQIAFTAIGEVAAGLSSDPAATRRKLDGVRGQVDARIVQSISANRFSADALGDGLGDAIGEALPAVLEDVVGGAVGAAVGAALGGNPERLQRLETLDADIEARIAPRAKALERSTTQLCRRMEALDALDNALEYRLPNGRPLGLLEVRPRQARTD